jgi:hypothetical protein
MSKYTTELRKVIEDRGEEEVRSWFMQYELTDYLTQDEINLIMERGTWNKEKLAQKIIDHYYMREIGFETVGLFKHQVKVAMQEIMEEKLPLIYSASIEYDPLVNVDFVEEYTGQNAGNSQSNSNGLTVQSDTPQGQISKANILAGKYASNTSANDIDDTTTTTGKESYTRRTKGNSGVSATAQKMVQQYRDNIIMIDRDIIRDLSSLFMSIY